MAMETTRLLGRQNAWCPLAVNNKTLTRPITARRTGLAPANSDVAVDFTNHVIHLSVIGGISDRNSVPHRPLVSHSCLSQETDASDECHGYTRNKLRGPRPRNLRVALPRDSRDRSCVSGLQTPELAFAFQSLVTLSPIATLSPAEFSTLSLLIRLLLICMTP